MGNLNPSQLIMALKQNNPQFVVQQIINNNFPNDPTMQNLLQLGNKGDIDSLQKIAKQMLGQQGLDFEKELKNLVDLSKNM